MNQRVRQTVLGSELAQQEGNQVSHKDQRWEATLPTPCEQERQAACCGETPGHG